MHSLDDLKSGKLAGITRLTLSENLTSFPMEILALADSLEILDLSGNQLADLPEEIKNLRKLKIFFASNNSFEKLPEAIGLCENLEMVGFKANKINTVTEHSLPAKLRWLILTDNELETLPNALGDRPRLQKLALAGNKLTSLPQTLSQLENLELIRISANQLSEFPKQLLDLPNLAWLAFAGNPFCKIEQENDAAIDHVPVLPSSSFELGEVLGQGASGVIYKAKWLQQNHQFPQQIAVKVFKGEITSDGYPEDELTSCLKVGNHANVVQSLARVEEPDFLALVMNLIPSDFDNLGLPPNFDTCTRDTYPADKKLTKKHIDKIVKQMKDVFEHLHHNEVCHGDLYAHNTLHDELGNIIFGDFGAASMYHMLPVDYKEKIIQIEQRALTIFVNEMESLKCKVATC